MQTDTHSIATAAHKRILLADDQGAVVEALRLLLKQEGYEADAVSHPEEVLSALQATKYAGQDKVNPGSVILSGEMMFRYMGWDEAADLIVSSLERTIAQKTVTYDFERLMTGATLLRTSEFGDAMIAAM